MKKIKLQLEPGQMLLLGEMIKVLLMTPASISNMLLERLVVVELYRRHIARFTIADGKAIALTPAEALALNRIMQGSYWVIRGSGGIATEIIRQLEPVLPARVDKNKPKLLLK